MCRALQSPCAAEFIASLFIWSKSNACHLPDSMSSSAKWGGPCRTEPPPDRVLQEVRSADSRGGVLQTVKGCAQGRNPVIRTQPQ